MESVMEQRKLGLTFSETMAGTYRLEHGDGDERGLVFHIDATTHDLWQTLRDGHVEAAGFVEAEDLAMRARIEGFLIIKPLLSRFIRYQLDFIGDDGARYRYAGQKTIRYTDIVRSWTTLPGAIYDERGERIAESTLRFDLKTLGHFLRSFSARLESPTETENVE
jgi:hypothetical protein